ncbi:hypothetical protein B0H65DRAFT_45452 [Neurospora tetraspora]|uniref:Uncharacterized protein n=1 Tax=Neurospora tetraspora TaxID=94610 RepID=A0AAE0JQ10_9PEZI|nr:hypothetical protein B0H65DRAFT_45452 [Neurospora tetraspora]
MVTTTTQAPSRRFPSMIEMASQAPSHRFPSMIEMAETASIRSVAPSYISEVPSYHSDRYSYADPYNLPAEPAPPYSPPAAGWDMAGRLGVLSSLVPATLPDPPEETRRERSRTRTRAAAATPRETSSGSTSRGTSRTASRTSGRATSDTTTATTTITRNRNRLGTNSAANDSSSTIARLGNNSNSRSNNRSTTNTRTSAAASSTSLPTTTTNAGSRPVAGTRTRAQTSTDTPSRSTNSSSPPPRVGLPPVPSGPPPRTDFPVLGDFRIPSLSSMSSNPNLRQYQNVAQRRAAANASTTNLDGLRRALDRIEEERNNNNPSNNVARPLEDPYLVGEVAAAKARRERLARENGDILVQENHRWDEFLNLMREQEERKPGWRRFRKNVETRTSKLPFRLGMRAR